MTVTVGRFSQAVIDLLGLSIPAGTPILLGDSNIDHMQRKHPSDYSTYGGDIEEILANPDYVGMNPNDGSVEYVREYKVGDEYVKVAVRISTTGRYFARSVYRLKNSRVEKFIKRGTLKKVLTS